MKSCTKSLHIKTSKMKWFSRQSITENQNPKYLYRTKVDAPQILTESIESSDFEDQKDENLRIISQCPDEVCSSTVISPVFSLKRGQKSPTVSPKNISEIGEKVSSLKRISINEEAENIVNNETIDSETSDFDLNNESNNDDQNENIAMPVTLKSNSPIIHNNNKFMFKNYHKLKNEIPEQQESLETIESASEDDINDFYSNIRLVTDSIDVEDKESYDINETVYHDYSEESQENISEDDISEDTFFNRVFHEEIDSKFSQEFFEQKKVIFRFLNDETDTLDFWKFDYIRVLKVKVIESNIDGFTDDIYHVVVRSKEVSHIKNEGDNFAMGIPYHIYTHNGDIYIIAPNVTNCL